MLNTNGGRPIPKPYRALSARLLSKDGLCILSGAVMRIDTDNAFVKFPKWCVPTACTIVNIAQVPSGCGSDPRQAATCKDASQTSMHPVRICPDGYAKLLDGVHEDRSSGIFSMEGFMFSRALPTSLTTTKEWKPHGLEYQSPGVSYHEIGHNAGICLLTGLITATVGASSSIKVGTIDLKQGKQMKSENAAIVSVKGETGLGSFIRQDNAKNLPPARLVINNGEIILDFGKQKPASGSKILLSLGGGKGYVGSELGLLGMKPVSLSRAGHSNMACFDKAKSSAKSAANSCDSATLIKSFDSCKKSVKQGGASVSMVPNPAGGIFASLCMLAGVLKFDQHGDEPGLVAFLPMQAAKECFPMNVLRVSGKDPKTGQLYSVAIEPQGTLRLEAPGKKAWKAATGGKGSFELKMDGAWYDPDALDQPEESIGIKTIDTEGLADEDRKASVEGDFCFGGAVSFNSNFGPLSTPMPAVKGYQGACLALARTYTIPPPGFNRMATAPSAWQDSKAVGTNKKVLTKVPMNQGNAIEPVLQRRALLKDVVIPVMNAGYIGEGTKHTVNEYSRNQWLCRCWVQKRLICVRSPVGVKCDQLKRLVRATGAPRFGPFGIYDETDAWAMTPQWKRDTCKYEDLDGRCNEPCANRLLAL